MKEINPKTSYAISATYGKGKYGKGRGTLIQVNDEQIQDPLRTGRDTDNSGGGRNSLTKKHSWDMIEVQSDSEEAQSVILQRSHGYNEGGEKEICPTITKNSFEHNNYVGNIRRLTEVECERLQGFPDGWTAMGMYPSAKVTQKQINKMSNEDLIALFNNTVTKKIPKGQRYKMCGNAVTVAVVELIGRKLLGE